MTIEGQRLENTNLNEFISGLEDIFRGTGGLVVVHRAPMSDDPGSNTAKESLFLLYL